MTNAFNQMAVQIALFQFFFFFSICFLGLLFIFIIRFYHHMSIFYTFNYLDLVHNIFFLNESTKQWNNQIVTIHGHFHTLMSCSIIYLKVILVPYSTNAASPEKFQRYSQKTQNVCPFIEQNVDETEFSIYHIPNFRYANLIIRWQK